MKSFFYSALLISNALLAGSIPNSQGFNKAEAHKINFTENKGQVHDQNFTPRTDVLFSGTDGKLVFHLKNNGLSYQLNRIDSWKLEDSALPAVGDPKANEKIKVIDQSTIYRIDMDWLNANTNSEIRKEGALPGYNNYYLESCPNGALNVKSYEQVEYQNIYNGVNLKWYQKEGQLKYDYIIAPHSDYKQIQLQIKGAEFQLLKNGSLLLKTPLGNIEEHAPIVFQNGKKLKANYVLEGNILSFNIQNYDPTLELIIDPAVRLWGTYYGGSLTDHVSSCIADASGNVYLAGQTDSNIGTVIATTGSHQTSFGGGMDDAFIVKFNTSGVRQWGTYYGGSGFDVGNSCATDASGNVYLAGYSDSNTGSVIATVGSHQAVNGGGYDAYLVKFNTNGLRQWGTYYGGTNSDFAFSCTIDILGNPYITGTSLSNTGTVIATAGSHQSINAGGSDGFLVKFNTSGVRQWGTYYGGSVTDYPRSCTTDASGNVFLAGYTGTNTGTVIATLGSHQPSYGGGGNDAFLAKFNSNGVRQWGTYYGGTANDIGYTCASDISGNIYLTGYTQSNTGTVIATAASHQSINGGGGNDAFLVKFDASGIRQWGTYYGGSGSDLGQSCTTDAFGNVYLVGNTDDPTAGIIATAGSHQSIHGGGIDAFLAKFNSIGVRQWGTYYGGISTDGGVSCYINPSGDIYLAGHSQSNIGNVIATVGAHQLTHAGSYDTFLVKFKDCPAIGASVNSPLCETGTLNFTTTVTNTLVLSYNWQGPNSFASNLQNPSIPNTAAVNAGIYTVTVNDGQGCTLTTTVNVSVNLKPIVTVNSGSICSGNSFTINPSGANTYTVQGGNAVVSPNGTSSYTVVGTSTSGCVSDIATSNVTVNATPTIAVNSGSICSGNSFTITPSGANTYTIQGGNALVSPLTNTNYTVLGTSSAGCLSNTFATSNITVYALPNIIASGSPSFICVGQSATLNATGALNYTWSPAIPMNSIISPSATLTYTIIGEDANGCHNTIFLTQNVDACTGLNQSLSSTTNILVYPNPTSGLFYLDLPQNADLILFNYIGQIIYQNTLEAGTTKLDLQHYANGVYVLQLKSINHFTNYRIIKN